MPGLVRKLLICAAADGLLLQPINLRDRSPDGSPVHISYGTSKITSRQAAQDETALADAFESYGIVGLLNLVSSSYLISITRRDQVASIRKHAIYTIKDVTLIPLSSQADAQSAIRQAQQQTQKTDAAAGGKGNETDESDIGEDAETHSIGDGDEEKPAEAKALEPPRPGLAGRGASVVKDVIQQKGVYGRFAQSWFSKGGWTSHGRRTQGWSSEEDLSKQAQTKDTEPEEAAKEDQETPKDDAAVEETATKPQQQGPRAINGLTPRIIRSTKLYFSSSSFYFSYDFDLSASLSKQQPPSTSLPLWKRFNEVFFWNRHLLKPFADAGRDELVLPLLQGFVGQKAFSVARMGDGEHDTVAKAADEPAALEESSTDPGSDAATENTFLLTLISRRSTKRAGLRYLRRGIDDDGNAANFVETEQLVACNPTDPAHRAFSLVQIRGSIPLFFSQTPYSFKPAAVTHGSASLNHEAFKKHFAKLTPYYGSIQCVSLVDKHEPEIKIGEAYEQHAKQFSDEGGTQDKSFGFEWFDFHGVCKGMKFEKVSVLMDTLQERLDGFGWTSRQQGKTLSQQTGVLRVNCMDCLDRTNVVQSAVAGRALQLQLAEVGFDIDLQKDPKTQWFNILWADNGDAISRQYAGTAALKGDFTRTRKRHWTGALSDFSLTLNRYFNNIFGDYFLQTVIDYQLGNADPSVFDEFETNMMSKDYAVDMDRVRQNAIDSCVKMVLEDPLEDFSAGWTLACPRDANTLHTLPFEECVLLLTNRALYFCRFDWNTEKVGSYERVHLTDIKALWRGAYITSTLGEAHLDANKNVGFVIRYDLTGAAPLVRRNTRSLQNEELPTGENEGKTEAAKQAEPQKNDSRLLAFKILPPQASASKQESAVRRDMSEKGLAEHICQEIHSALTRAVREDRGVDHLDLEKVPQVEERDVVSAADAKKSTGYLESIGYSLKKLVW